MATNQKNDQLSDLFPPVFGDPATVAQMAALEMPSQEPQGQNAIPGMVPRSFTEYSQDPFNVAKIPDPVAPNTPLPTLKPQQALGIATGSNAAPTQPPPVDSAIQGAPEYTPTLAGPPQAQPMPEDSLFSAPPTAAASPAPGAPSSTFTRTPTRDEYFANGQHQPVLPGAPPEYRGKKLAAMGLFAALDSIGAALDHGEASVAPGLMRNAQASIDYKRNLPAMLDAAQTAKYEDFLKGSDTAAQADQRNAQTQSMVDKVPVSMIGPDGKPVTYYVSQKDLPSSVVKPTIAGDAKIAATHITADNQQALAEFKAMLDAGKVAFTKPIVDDQGKAVWGAYDKHGNLIKTLDKSIGPAWLQPTVRSSVQVKENASGGYDYIPVTSTTRRLFPGSPGAPGTPAATKPFGAPPTSTTQTSTTAPPTTQANAPAPAPGGGAARPVPTSAVHPVISANGTQEFGKSGGDTGYAVDPKSGQTMLTTRMEAGTKGLSDFRKVPQGEIDKDKSTANRLNDVETKLNRYSDALSDSGLTEDDRSAIGKIIRSDKLKLGAFGLEVPVDQVNLWMRENRLGQLSDAGVKTLAAYYNARESMSGYQRVLSGSSRGSDKTMELNIDALPKPTDGTRFAMEALKQFKENIPIMRRGLPVLPGVNDGPSGQPKVNPAAAPQTNKYSHLGVVYPGQ